MVRNTPAWSVIFAWDRGSESSATPSTRWHHLKGKSGDYWVEEATKRKSSWADIPGDTYACTVPSMSMNLFVEWNNRDQRDSHWELCQWWLHQEALADGD